MLVFLALGYANDDVALLGRILEGIVQEIDDCLTQNQPIRASACDAELKIRASPNQRRQIFMPLSSLWGVGILAGVNILLSGVTRLLLALAIRREA